MFYWLAIGPRRFKFNNLITFSGKYIYAETNSSVRRNRINTKHIDKLLKYFIIQYLSIMMSYQTILTGPLYAYIHDNLRISPLGTHIPFFELNSDAEFYTNMVHQVLIGAYTIFGSVMIELMICIVNRTITAIPDLTSLTLKEFFEEFKLNGINSKSNAQLRNVFLQLQDFNKYVFFHIAR